MTASKPGSAGDGMSGPSNVFIKSIALEGFLSFAPGTPEVPLRALNVLIGPNASGKSNFIEALSVLRAVPKDLPLPIRQGGGVKDWLWRPDPSIESGIPRGEAGSGVGSGGYGTGFADGSGAGGPAARLEVIFGEGRIARFQSGNPAVRYRLVFGAEGDSFVVLDERLENAEPVKGKEKPYLYFGYQGGRPILNVKEEQRELRREDIDRTQSILSQRRDPDMYPELTRMADELARIRIYRSWQFGPDARVRAACAADARTDRLSETFDNLPARLAALKRSPAVKKRLLELIHELAPGFTDFEVIPEGGTLNLYLTEGSLSFPARRLSDGTLRYLCLLAMLVDPDPPPLMVIEEPELGLHPDIVPVVARLLVEASAGTQLIVTTHSDILVDALSEHPESVVVCERGPEGTQLQRLDSEKLAPWLKEYRLGTLWTRGDLGGTRW